MKKQRIFEKINKIIKDRDNQHIPIADKVIEFIDEQAEIIVNVSTKYTTQFVDSVNATYGRVFPKKSKCNRIRGRIASGIIKQNSPADAPFLIRKCCSS